MENHILVAKGFDILNKCMARYIVQELYAAYGDDWWQKGVLDGMYEDQKRDLPASGTLKELVSALDVLKCLQVLDLQWGKVFRKKLSKDCRSWVNELKGARNEWAHRGALDIPDKKTIRALDTMSLLCEQLNPDGAAEINKLLRLARYGSEDGSVAATANASVQIGRAHV